MRITYDKTRQVLDLAATIAPGLLPDSPNESDRPEGRSQINDIAGRDSNLRLSDDEPISSHLPRINGRG